MQMTLGSAVSSIPPCDDDCPFCKEEKYLGYTTKHGEQKKESVLASNLRSKQEITNDRSAGKVYPLSGGDDQTIGWEAEPGVFEDFTVGIPAAPHHLIPGNAAMAPSRLEDWTRESKGKIREDIGYSIDCAQNGIFLPHLPEIYFTRYKSGTKIKQSAFYGQTWLDLSASVKESIGFLLMGETSLQMHYTDHSAVFAGSAGSYDDICKSLCNGLADAVSLSYGAAKCKDDDGKVAPPYAVVIRTNGLSRKVKRKITGHPENWSAWVSPLAHDLTVALNRPNASSIQKKFLIRCLTK